MSYRTAAVLCLAALTGCGEKQPAQPGPAVAAVEIVGADDGLLLPSLHMAAPLVAIARDAQGLPIPGMSFSWVSSGPAVVVSVDGVVSARVNGTARVQAIAGGIASVPLYVTVEQAPAAIIGAPAEVAIGAPGRTYLFQASVVDPGGTRITKASVSWSLTGTGEVASILPSGLLTALAVGTDTAVGTAAGLQVRVPVRVTHELAVVFVYPQASRIATTGRTIQYLVIARDSLGQSMPWGPVTWSSSDPTVATIDPLTGLATAVGDGTATITATPGGTSQLVVHRYPAEFTITPLLAEVTTAGGSTAFTAAAFDSAGVALPITWAPRTWLLASFDTLGGSTTTATALVNGQTDVLALAGGREVSADLVVSGQASDLPMLVSVDVHDGFIRSPTTGTTNPAVDTLAVGGTVRWSFVGTEAHQLRPLSTGIAVTPTLASGTHEQVLSAPGLYVYYCHIHGSAENGRIVVR